MQNLTRKERRKRTEFEKNKRECRGMDRTRALEKRRKI